MVEGENRVRKGEGEGKSLLLTWRAWSQMEEADKEEWREEKNTDDVIQEALFFVFLLVSSSMWIFAFFLSRILSLFGAVA